MEKFNVRVYGVCTEADKVLVTDEIFRIGKTCKFPGGGLEYGEGTVECLEREFLEELGVKAEVKELLYINPFYQASITRSTDQILCIYYRVKLLEKPENVRFTEKKFDFLTGEEGEQVFRWVKISEVNPDDFTFKADRELWKDICHRLG